MSQKYQGTNNTSSDFLKVLLALKKNVFKDLKVAGLAQVKSIKDDIFTVQPFPILSNELDKNIQCIAVSNLWVKEGDVVLLLYTDRNFIQNLKQVKLGQKLTPLKSDAELHSEKYGIIIALVHSK